MKNAGKQVPEGISLWYHEGMKETKTTLTAPPKISADEILTRVSWLSRLGE